ncbi:FAD:protein FMN transferase [Companilactobacillus mishanensis]|uniref:FAD:protein FMN transferase n=1 Tax=Companilactobacillus mishanensis TaxID=2486008 RepID=A0A5P0ZL51_9LACO|nr:FAD:protein FMN transferase [Companilactobacillus mishanensis]MQS53397.1 FAD:protein FMN transferase [Companilactobacillus mishanensis]
MPKFTNTYHALGTKINLTVYSEIDWPYLDEAYHLIQHYEDVLTVNRSKSELMSINHASGKHAVKVSSISYQIVKKAVEVSLENDGFNAAIGPLVKLWHIGFSNAHVPTDEQVQERMKLIDPKQIVLNDDEKSVYLLKKGMELDLGGIAKGYIADAIKDLWHSNHVERGIIDLGGNILLVGDSQHSDKLWNVGVQSPFDHRSESLGMLHIPDFSIVTSGIYERFLKSGGHNYHHILDPKTGYPVQNDLVGVTVVSPMSITGEIWSSLGFYNDYDKTEDLLADEQDVGLIFVYKDREVRVTKNLKGKFKITDDSFKLIN